MRLESVSVIGVLIVASGLGYAWWIARARRKGNTDPARNGVMGRATVTAVRQAQDGRIEVSYTFRHPFSGDSFSRVGTLRPGADAPHEGDHVDIAYVPDDPRLSCLIQELDNDKQDAFRV